MNYLTKTFLLFTLSFGWLMPLIAQNKGANIIKANIPALFFSNFSFQYERVTSKKQSFLFAVRFRPEGGVPFRKTVEDIVDDNSIRVDLAKIGCFGFTPEYRFYVGKQQAPYGFYIGPLLNYNHYNGNLPINYNDYDDVNNQSIERTAVFRGSVNSFTAGFQLGAQWKLSNKISLDWWIVGPNYGLSKGDFDFSGMLNDIEEISMDFELNKIKETIPLIKIKDINVRENGTGASFKIDGPWAGIRAMGINLGYRF